MREFKLLYVYMLKCSDNSFYVGITNNLSRRIEEHNEGLIKKAYTQSRRPVELIFWQEFSDYTKAIEWETRLKKWSREKKQALADANWEKVKKAAACKNKTAHTKF